MPFNDNEATPRNVPASERWRLFREMIQESDDKRRAVLARQYYRMVHRDALARYREDGIHPDGR